MKKLSYKKWLPAALSACWICIKHLWCKECPTDLIIVAAVSSTMFLSNLNKAKLAFCFLLCHLSRKKGFLHFLSWLVGFIAFLGLMPMLVFRSGNMARRCITHNHSGGKSRERTARISHLINFLQRSIFHNIFFNKRSKFPTDSFETYHVIRWWSLGGIGYKQPFWCCLTVWISPKKIPDLEILTLENSFKLSAIYSSSPCWALPPFCCQPLTFSWLCGPR